MKPKHKYPATAKGKPTLDIAWGRANTPEPKRDLKKLMNAAEEEEVAAWSTCVPEDSVAEDLEEAGVVVVE